MFKYSFGNAKKSEMILFESWRIFTAWLRILKNIPESGNRECNSPEVTVRFSEESAALLEFPSKIAGLTDLL